MKEAVLMFNEDFLIWNLQIFGGLSWQTAIVTLWAQPRYSSMLLPMWTLVEREARSTKVSWLHRCVCWRFSCYSKDMFQVTLLRYRLWGAMNMQDIMAAMAAKGAVRQRDFGVGAFIVIFCPFFFPRPFGKDLSQMTQMTNFGKAEETSN